jgi:hypothetical protein
MKLDEQIRALEHERELLIRRGRLDRAAQVEEELLRLGVSVEDPLGGAVQPEPESTPDKKPTKKAPAKKPARRKD